VVDAFDDPNAEADLAVYRSEYGLGNCTSSSGCFRKVNQIGGTVMPAPSQTWAPEISLDLDMVSAVCPNCHILLVEANNDEPGNLAAAENEAVRLGASEVSDSFEEEESSADASAYDHPGVPIAAAGGDNGFGVVSPAASPHVIAVGGTSLRPAETRRGWSESVWYSESPREGTGSGCSREPKPAWQTDSGCAHRTANDIAAVADPNTPVSAYDSYNTAPAWKLLGGTSVSAPIVAAAMALATPYTRSFDGAQALYLETAAGGALNDVTAGFNGRCGTYLCEAQAGYDGPSGLGTVHGAPEVLPPLPTTVGTSATTTTQATLLGSVSTYGVALTECRFEYGAALPYTASVPCSTLPGPQIGAVNVSGVAGELLPGTTYYFRLIVSYAGGSSSGEDLTFVTAGLAPSVFTGGSSGVTSSSASLSASVNPNGTGVTGCNFEYGPSASYGADAPCSPVPGQGRTAVLVSATISGLAANRTYHYRVRATNAYGTSYGADRTLVLPPPPPTVTTGAASAIGHAGATLNAIVDANGSALTTCAFEFNSSETLIPCSAMPGPQLGPTDVSANVAGLRSGSTFRYRILAANTGGTSYGRLAEFTTLPTRPRVSATAARLASSRLLASATGTIHVAIRCPNPHTRCRGTVTLRSSPAAARGGHGGSVIVAAGPFVVPPRRVVAVRLRLEGFGRRLLAHLQTITASATLRTIGPSGVSAWHGRVTIASHPH
jgi:hypothetical protein